VLKDKALLDLTFTHSDKTLSVTSLYQATDTLKGLGVKKLEYESKDTNDTLWKAGIKEGSVHSTEFVKERLFAAKELMAEQQRHNSG
jgi:hypothetical protein